MKQLKEIKKMNNVVALGSHRHVIEASNQLNNPENELQFFDVKFWVDECHTQRQQIEDIIAHIRHVKQNKPLAKRISIMTLRQQLALSWKQYKSCHKRTTRLYNQYMAQLSAPRRYAEDISISIAA